MTHDIRKIQIRAEHLAKFYGIGFYAKGAKRAHWLKRAERELSAEASGVNYGLADAFMGIFGFKRTICPTPVKWSRPDLSL